jgi:hypothetical protein
VTPFRSPSGAWSIPLPDRRPSRVGLLWKTGPSPSGPAANASWRSQIPRAGSGRVPTLVSIFAPGAVTIDTDAGGLEPVTMAQLESARADGLARSFADLVARLDRSSGRDHEKLVSLLINHEMALRSAERSAQANDPRTAISPTVGASGVLELARSARNSRSELMRRSGLDEDLASAQRYLGLASAEPSRGAVGVPEATLSERIPCLGRPSTFAGLVPGVDEQGANASFIAQGRDSSDLVSRSTSRGLAAIVLLGALAVAGAFIRPGRVIAGLLVVMALGLAACTGGPLTLAGGLAFAAAGWKRSRS